MQIPHPYTFTNPLNKLSHNEQNLCILGAVVFVVVIIIIPFLLYNIVFSNSGHIDTGVTNVDSNMISKPEEKSMV